MMDPDTDPRPQDAPACPLCGEPVLAGELAGGMQPTHYECLVRAVAGGVNHQLGTCSCRGGTEPPDPPGLSPRQAALAALETFDRLRTQAQAAGPVISPGLFAQQTGRAKRPGEPS